MERPQNADKEAQLHVYMYMRLSGTITYMLVHTLMNIYFPCIHLYVYVETLSC